MEQGDVSRQLVAGLSDESVCGGKRVQYAVSPPQVRYAEPLKLLAVVVVDEEGLAVGGELKHGDHSTTITRFAAGLSGVSMVRLPWKRPANHLRRSSSVGSVSQGYAPAGARPE